MDTCQHCQYTPSHFMMAWHYPGERYQLAAKLCWWCSEAVRLRHHRGLLVVDEDLALPAWYDLVEGRVAALEDL